MKVVVTGGAGFVGWHTRVRLRALTGHEVVAVDRAEWPDLARYVQDADAIVHLAGVNRGADDEVVQGNIVLARAVAEVARGCGRSPRIVFANSVQSTTDTPYGAAKRAASEILAKAAADLGAPYVDVQLPNLFGEHGLARYNSFVATFARAVIDGQTPEIVDRPIRLLHVQRAAQVLIDALSTTAGQIVPSGTPTTVRAVYEFLRDCGQRYSGGDIPPLSTDMDIDLFNALRAAWFGDRHAIALTPRTDQRGALVEVVRVHGGQGQTFVSTSMPGVTRGEHYHLRKIERFVVLSGTARISLRRLLSDEVITVNVRGDAPVAVDIPTMWTHNITNVGKDDLVALFWSNELFNPDAPDTFAEPVDVSSDRGRCVR